MRKKAPHVLRDDAVPCPEKDGWLPFRAMSVNPASPLRTALCQQSGRLLEEGFLLHLKRGGRGNAESGKRIPGTAVR